MLRDVPRAIAKALWRACRGYSKQNWASLRSFICVTKEWQLANVKLGLDAAQAGDGYRICALKMFHVILAHRQKLFCSIFEWTNFLYLLDQLEIIGDFGSLQSIDLLVCMIELCNLPDVNISLLGMLHILNRQECLQEPDMQSKILHLVVESSDNYNFRRDCTYLFQNPNIQATSSLFVYITSMENHFQKALIFSLLWTFCQSNMSVRSQIFPIVDSTDDGHTITSYPPVSATCANVVKKDFLVFLPPKKFVLSRISSCIMIKYEPFWYPMWSSYIGYMFSKITNIVTLWNSAKFLWAMHCQQQQYTLFHNIIKKIQKLQIFVLYGKHCVFCARFCKLVLIRLHLSKWALRAQTTTKQNLRKKQRKRRKKEKLHIKRSLILTEHTMKKRQQLQNLLCAVVRIQVVFTRIIRKTKLQLIYKKEQVLNNIQKELTCFIITPQGRRLITNARMLRSLLKQMLRIVVKCLTFFDSIVDTKTMIFRNYIQLFTFAVEPFLFYVQTAPDFAKYPSTTEFLNVTQTLLSRKFSSNLLDWILENQSLRAYVGCMPVFRCVTSLFVEYFAFFHHIPHHMLHTTVFIPFTFDGIEKPLYEAFCKKYATLSITWVIDHETLANIVEQWLQQGGQNINLLDMLNQIQKTYMKMEKQQQTIGSLKNEKNCISIENPKK